MKKGSGSREKQIPRPDESGLGMTSKGAAEAVAYETRQIRRLEAGGTTQRDAAGGVKELGATPESLLPPLVGAYKLVNAIANLAERAVDGMAAIQKT